VIPNQSTHDRPIFSQSYLGTAARGLAKLLPPIKVGFNPTLGTIDPYNQESVGVDDNDENTALLLSKEIPTPFVDLPIGATEDRILGSIDFSATLKGGGKPVFSPGLLGAANRGILYIDEVNLLPAHLVDVLLDASASGVNVVQREGMTLEHPARFILIGTMNPEEGNLRPQLLDRFGLVCDVLAPRDAVLRSEVVRQRMSFERDHETFGEKWKASETHLSERIKASRARLLEMEVPEDFILLISTICVEFHVASLRADITLYKTAVALAAWEGRNKVQKEDIKRAAKWVLAHRKNQNPFDSPPPPPGNDNQNNQEDDLMDEILNAPPPKSDDDGGNEDQNQQQQHDDNQSPESQEDTSETDGCDEPQQSNDDDADKNNNNNNGDDDKNMQTFTASKPQQIKKLRLKQQNIKGQALSGKRNALPNNSSKVGRYARSTPTNKPVDLALDATLRAGAVNGLDPTTGMPIIRPENWRKKVRHATTNTLIMFVVDASGSMSARQRMETVKGAVLALLKDAYQQRDNVGVISFRGPKAEVLLEATNSVDLAEKKLKRLPTGGRTPLAHALALTHETLQRVLRKDPEQAILLILLSDGKANVPLPEAASGDAWTQTEQKAMELASLAIPTLFLDTDSGHVRIGKGKELAEQLGADYLLLDGLTTDSLVHTIRQVGGG
jgi:magnesium chelatase subunit D